MLEKLKIQDFPITKLNPKVVLDLKTENQKRNGKKRNGKKRKGARACGRRKRTVKLLRIASQLDSA